MSQIRVLVVEDELYSRAKLVHFLMLTDQVAEVREAENGLEGLKTLASWTPDLIIADIHMPHLDGLEMIDQLEGETRPTVIFTTAYRDYALRAFEVNALDYLLKPFSFDRFMISFKRFIDHKNLMRQVGLDMRHDEENHTHLPEQPSAVTEPDEQSQYLAHIRVEGPGRTQKILSLSQVKLIRSSGNYAEFFVTPSDSYLRRGSLKDLMTRLDPQVFLRINRSEVVRIEEILEVSPKAHGDAELLMKYGGRFKWSRRYRAEDGSRFEI